MKQTYTILSLLTILSIAMPAFAQNEPKTYMNDRGGVTMAFEGVDQYSFENDGTVRLMGSNVATECDAEHKGSIRWAQWGQRFEGCDGEGTWRALTAKVPAKMKVKNPGVMTCQQAIDTMNGITGNASGFIDLGGRLVAGDGTWMLYILKGGDAATIVNACAPVSKVVTTLGLIPYGEDEIVVKGYFGVHPGSVLPMGGG